jgi:tetratricopeptide (TPR) repeat protein
MRQRVRSSRRGVFAVLAAAGLAFATPAAFSQGLRLGLTGQAERDKTECCRAAPGACVHLHRAVPLDGYYYYGWPGYRWSSRPYKHLIYPPPVALEERLGLHHNYPYAWQMGLRLPEDADPLVTPSLGPYRGVVRSPQGWLQREEFWAVSLLRQGKYQEAGRRLAAAYRESDDPRDPLYLAEALFALGKYAHAEMVFRHALGLPGAFDVLPEDVAAHFPSREEYEMKVEALQGLSGLLAAYLQLFTKDGSRGLDALAELMVTADGEIARKLYRRYLSRAFEPPAPQAAPVGEEEPGDEKPAEEEQEDAE